jgi:hypothetical protein
MAIQRPKTSEEIELERRTRRNRPDPVQQAFMAAAQQNGQVRTVPPGQPLASPTPHLQGRQYQQQQPDLIRAEEQRRIAAVAPRPQPQPQPEPPSPVMDRPPQAGAEMGPPDQLRGQLRASGNAEDDILQRMRVAQARGDQGEFARLVQQRVELRELQRGMQRGLDPGPRVLSPDQNAKARTGLAEQAGTIVSNMLREGEAAIKSGDHQRGMAMIAEAERMQQGFRQNLPDLTPDQAKQRTADQQGMADRFAQDRVPTVAAAQGAAREFDAQQQFRRLMQEEQRRMLAAGVGAERSGLEAQAAESQRAVQTAQQPIQTPEQRFQSGAADIALRQQSQEGLAVDRQSAWQAAGIPNPNEWAARIGETAQSLGSRSIFRAGALAGNDAIGSQDVAGAMLVVNGARTLRQIAQNPATAAEAKQLAGELLRTLPPRPAGGYRLYTAVLTNDRERQERTNVVWSLEDAYTILSQLAAAP